MNIILKAYIKDDLCKYSDKINLISDNYIEIVYEIQNLKKINEIINIAIEYGKSLNAKVISFFIIK